VDRRAFIGTLTGALLAAPLAAEAQQAGKMPRIGILSPASTSATPVFEALRRGLRDLGYEDGGLVSYGPNVPANFYRTATYVDKILKGSKPGDLPIQQPTTFELFINLKTAKALGLIIPSSLLQRADQVIE
jgi:hypothetical protein